MCQAVIGNTSHTAFGPKKPLAEIRRMRLCAGLQIYVSIYYSDTVCLNTFKLVCKTLEITVWVKVQLEETGCQWCGVCLWVKTWLTLSSLPGS
jgi:hypothetical protein